MKDHPIFPFDEPALLAETRARFHHLQQPVHPVGDSGPPPAQGGGGIPQGRLVEAAGWRVLRTEYCMLILSRLVIALLQALRIPLPLNPLLMLENLVPAAWRSRLLPHDIVVVATIP